MSIGKFDPTRESITNYLERLEIGFILHAFTEDSMKRALLIHEIGDTNYDVLKSLVAPDKPADKTYAQLSEKLKSHFNPKPNKIVKRYEVRTRYRKLDDNMSDYIAALKKIATQCEYGDHLEENICDQLVCGVRDEGITNKVLQEVDLDYTKAITLATQIELSHKGAKSLTCRGGEDVGEIHFTNRAKPKKPIMKQVNVNGKPMNFQVDTGSSFTIMGYDKYEDFKDKYGLGQLKSVVAFPRTFTGEEVKMKGQVTVQVTINQFSKKLSLLVAPCKGPVLLGRDWISEITPNMYNFSQWNIKRRVKIDKANLMQFCQKLLMYLTII